MSIFIFTLILGGLTVIQGGLNRQIMTTWGLSTAVLINASVLLIATLSVFFVMQKWPQFFPDSFVPRGLQFRWWYVIPAFCGLMLLFGVPAAITKIGALQVFLAVVSGQMIVSLFWDNFVEGISFNPYRIGGAIMCILGLWLASLK